MLNCAPQPSQSGYMDSSGFLYRRTRLSQNPALTDRTDPNTEAKRKCYCPWHEELLVAAENQKNMMEADH